MHFYMEDNMKKQFCATCWTPVQVPDDYDDMREKCVCSSKCYWIEWLFCCYYSDDEVAEKDGT